MSMIQNTPHSATPNSSGQCACRLNDSEFAGLVAGKRRIWKRTMDIAGALAALLLLIPVFGLIALYIKIASPGPVFFRQQRVGRGGRLFDCIKFRTMKHNADTANHRQHLSSLINQDSPDGRKRVAMTKLHEDPQIIPFGNVLRESGLDELPQLINVLRGEMSLVGPRPPIPYEVQEYKIWYKDRFDVQPGITGLWQVSGKNRLTFNEMIRLDIKYTRQVSLWLDLRIILMTPYAVASQFRDYLHRKLFTESPSTIHSA